MSLVEKALRKLQQSQRPASGTAAPSTPASLHNTSEVFGSVVATGTDRVSDSDNALAPVSQRSIEINITALRAAGLLSPEHQERQLSQQYRQIKRPLIAGAFGKGATLLPGGHLIMMASAVPGEGKTFTSLNLAFSMALEKDIRVLLVDADMPKPHISKLLGVDREPGLLDALRDHDLDVESLILQTNVPNLSVLPTGRQSENATELLASDRMRDIVRRISHRDRHRIVLFDSPPLLLTTESQALAQLAGQIVVVVRAGVTPHQTVLDAINYLGEGKPVSLILNQSITTSATGYYYYGYGGASHENV